MRLRGDRAAWTLRIDGTRCDGHGICALRCPELITLDERGFAGVDPVAIAGSRTLRRARRAAAGCPERALFLLPVRSAGQPPAEPSTAGRLQHPAAKLPVEEPVSRTGGRG